MAIASRPVTAPPLRLSTTARFVIGHACVPLGCAVLLSALLMGAGLDQTIADVLYRIQGDQWALKEAWSTQMAIHRGGKWVSIAAATSLMLLALVPWRKATLARLRRPAAYVVLSIAVSTVVVSLLKHWTGMDCPWDLARYGGTRPFMGLLASRHGLAASGCFPAGHASAGYAWVALYFAALAVRPAWRWPALLPGLGAGLLFGISQQLRGAHFASHDLWSLTISWLTAFSLYLLMLKPHR